MTDPTPKRPRGRPRLPKSKVAVEVKIKLRNRAAEVFPGRSMADSVNQAIEAGCSTDGAETFRSELEARDAQIDELRERLASIARLASGGAL